MIRIPAAALILGLAGLIPFLWGAATVLQPGLSDWGVRMIGPRFVGPYLQLFYGGLILSFMSGVLWGFATKAQGQQAVFGYAVSVAPVLWVFFMTGDGVRSSAINLITGFLALLVLDWYFWQARLAPSWWMQLRVILTAIVVASLIVVLL